jgi:hypothetical protein
MTEEQKRIERAIELACRYGGTDEMHHLQWVVGNDSNLLIVFYVQIMPDDFVMQLHRF